MPKQVGKRRKKREKFWDFFGLIADMLELFVEIAEIFLDD